MLNDKEVYPTIPVTDVKKSVDFYQNKLGLKMLHEANAEALFEAAHGFYISLYQRGPSKADHTLAEFKVDNIEVEMKELMAKGVEFEEYDIPEMNLKTVNRVATMGDYQAAWFKDPDGNILALFEGL